MGLVVEVLTTLSHDEDRLYGMVPVNFLGGYMHPLWMDTLDDLDNSSYPKCNA